MVVTAIITASFLLTVNLVTLAVAAVQRALYTADQINRADKAVAAQTTVARVMQILAVVALVVARADRVLYLLDIGSNNHGSFCKVG
jgi:hypothetical protein